MNRLTGRRVVTRMASGLRAGAAVAALAAGALGAMGASCAMAADKTGPAVDRNTLVVALDKEIQSLDALITASGDSQRYAMSIFDTLYGFDTKGNIVPRMASSYTMSSDGLTYTFKLRPNIKFHNGDLFTSGDVKYSIERVIDPASKSTRRPYFAPRHRRHRHARSADGPHSPEAAGRRLPQQDCRLPVHRSTEVHIVTAERRSVRGSAHRLRALSRKDEQGRAIPRARAFRRFLR